jgi:hypothetical protein
MLADVAHALAIDPYFSSVVETVEEFPSSVGKERSVPGVPGPCVGVVARQPSPSCTTARVSLAAVSADTAAIFVRVIYNSFLPAQTVGD